MWLPPRASRSTPSTSWIRSRRTDSRTCWIIGATHRVAPVAWSPWGLGVTVVMGRRERSVSAYCQKTSSRVRPHPGNLTRMAL